MRGGDERIFGTLMRFSKTEENFVQKSELRSRRQSIRTLTVSTSTSLW